MINDIGQSAVIAAFIIASVMPFMGLIGLKKAPYNSIKMLAIAQWFNAGLITIAFLTLVYAFVISDFSLKLVLMHSDNNEPWIYRATAIWSNHEGSLLLWILTLTAYGSLVSLTGPRAGASWQTQFYTQFFMHFIIAAFLGFLLTVSNPFEGLSIAPKRGLGMNPLLQDPSMAYHPPTLYFGYVGFVVPFAMALGVLIKGQFLTTDVLWMRRWTLIPWIFLTLGITGGSFWAYYELGWGGWWFWDPVENASLLPWLTATALLHTLTVARKVGSLKRWSLFLGLLTFIFCLLGTYVTRSGIVASVHGFAQDQVRGLYLLILTGVTTLVAMGLFFLRFHQIKTMVLVTLRPKLVRINVWILLFLAFALISGIFFPLISPLMDQQAITFDENFYNRIINPFGFVILILMGIVPWVSWQKQVFKGFLKVHATGINISLAILVFLLFTLKPTAILGVLGIAISIWTILISLKSTYYKWRKPSSMAYNPWAMIMAHLGFAIMVLGMSVDVTFTQEKHVWLNQGEQTNFISYQIKLQELKQQDYGHYISDQATVKILDNNKVIGSVTPERRLYKTRSAVITETAILQLAAAQLYFVLGPALDSGQRSLKIIYHPLVFLIWMGGILMAIGVSFSLLPRWRRNRLSSKKPSS